MAPPVHPVPGSIREQLAAGPKFEADANGRCVCIACPASGMAVDATTGLCVSCWRVMRFVSFPIKPSCGCKHCAEQESAPAT